MKRTAYLFLFGILSTAGMAQMFSPELNALDSKEYGEPVKANLITQQMEDDKIPPIPVEISVLLKKPIVMGCQYIYRVVNKSTEHTLRLKLYAVYDQQYETKIKPGGFAELLANTMSRCGETKEERKGEKGCLNCQPSLNITEITVK